MTITCIYKITHTPTGRIYVGSATDYEKRVSRHLCLLRKNTHQERLQSAWNADGELSIVFSIIELVSNRSELFKREQFWIEQLRATEPPNFNMCPNAGTTKGRITSEATKAKMRESQRLIRSLRKMDQEHKS